MKKINLLLSVIILAMIMSCGGETKTTEKEKKESDKTKTEAEEATEADANVIDPFKKFPDVKLTANAGDYILTPSLDWQEAATKDGPESQVFIFYKANVKEVGDAYSVVDFTFDDDTEIPNYMIVPIKSGQTAKVGDIVLTWWQSGSGMKRAIVTDATNPAQPKVNYIDIDWDNPAKKDDVPLGQIKEEIEENSFHVLKDEWEPGTTVAIKTGKDYTKGTVISISEDKVLAIVFGGIMEVYEKSQCTPLPVYPKVKVGDEVQAPSIGFFINTKVLKVDNEYGRIWCEDPYSDDEPMIVPFGDVTTGLDI